MKISIVSNNKTDYKVVLPQNAFLWDAQPMLKILASAVIQRKTGL